MSDSSQGSGGPAGREIVGEVVGFDPQYSARRALQALHAVSGRHALIGGLALEAWGVPRATRNLDLAVPTGVAERAARELTGPGILTRPLRIGGVGVRGEEPTLRIDFIDRRHHFASLFLAALDEAEAANRWTRLAEHEVPLVSREHLVAMKLVSGAPKDDADVRRLLQLEDLDYSGARALVEAHLGPATANRLDAFAREAGRAEVETRYTNGDPFGEVETEGFGPATSKRSFDQQPTES